MTVTQTFRTLFAALLLAWAGVTTLGAVSAAPQAAAPAAQAPAAGARRSVWDGVYTTAQAARGKEAFLAHCDVCHGIDPNGTPGRFMGELFWGVWGDDAFPELLKKVVGHMVDNGAKPATDAEYADVLAFLLANNEVPAGSTELKTTDIASISLIRKGGPAKAPVGAVVIVVGCLAKAGDVWQVENGSQPLRSRATSITADLPRAAGLEMAGVPYPLEFPLIRLDPMLGKKVLARGILLASGGINIEAVRSLGTDCAK